MKIKNVVTVWVVAFSLVSCLPTADVVPIETKIPTSTFIPILPTSTITPEPFNRMVTVNGAGEKKILDIAFSPEGTKLAIFANTGIYIYDTNTLDMTIFQRFDNFNYDMYFVGTEVGALAFAFDENTIAISGKTANTPVELWNINTGDHVMSITDIPPSSGVIKIQFSPDSNSIFIRSFYGFTSRCEQADANFSLHLLDFSESPKATKVFSNDVCQTIPSGFIRFTDNNEFLLFVQLMGPEYWLTTLDITPFAVAEKHVYEDTEELYDISPGGEIYAFLGMKDHLLVTNLVEANTSKTLQTVPYRVKLLNDEHRLLVRDFSAEESEWKLLENGNIACTFSGLTNSRFSWELSENEETFAVLTSSNDVIIWNVSSCSIKNVLHFGK